MINISYNTEEETITCAFTGKMDLLAAQKLSDIIAADALVKDHKPEDKMVFDLGEVDYVASSFIRICVTYAKVFSNGKFSISNCQPFVKKTFKISGLDELLNIQ